MNKKAIPWISVSLIGAAVTLFVQGMVQANIFSLDDAYILFRYAENWRVHGFLSWNPGDPIPVEGYTSFLWVAILALINSANQLIAARVISALSLAGTASLLLWILRSVSLDRRLACLLGSTAVTIFFVNPDLVSHANSGMETALGMFLTTAFVAGYFRLTKSPSLRSGALLGCIALLGGLNRPDTNVIFGITLLGLLFQSGKIRKSALVALALYSLLGGIYFLWRYHHFSLLFPLPFYLKQSSLSALSGWSMVQIFLSVNKHLLALALFGLLSRRAWRSSTLPLIGGVAAHIFYLSTITHFMGDYFRFFMPIYPTLVTAALYGLKTLLCEHRIATPIKALLILLIFSTFTYQQITIRRAVISQMNNYGGGLQSTHVHLGKALRRFDSSGKRSLAISDAGAAPYFSKWNTLDMFGLNDRQLAFRNRLPYNYSHVIDSKPDVVALISSHTSQFTPLLPFERTLYEQFMSGSYKRLASLRFAKKYHLWILTSLPEEEAKELGQLLMTKE